MSIIIHQLRCVGKQITVLLLIAGLALLLPAGNFGFSGRYARAQVTFGEPSPSTGDTSGQTSGQAAPAGSAPAGQATGSGLGNLGTPGTVTGDTTLGYAVQSGKALADGNAPKAPNTAQSVSLAGSAASFALSLAGLGPIGFVVAVVFVVVAAFVSFFSGPKASGEDITDPGGLTEAPQAPVQSMVDPDTAPPGPTAPCFKADTRVLTAIKSDGSYVYKKIEDFKIGDEVMGIVFNKDGLPAAQKSKVLKFSLHEPASYSFSKLITTQGVEIVGTNNHPFVTDSRNGHTALADLKSGNSVFTLLSGFNWDSVNGVVSLPSETVPVFNIKTGTENYLVSQDGKSWVLVHNGNGSSGSK